MDCNNCKWLRIYDYKFPDGTQTMECIKYNRFLGFTTSTGETPTLRKNRYCIHKEVLSKHTQESLPKSNVKGITWDKRDKSWKVSIWDKSLKKKVHLGQHKDLDQAIKILEDWLKRGDNG